MALQERERRLLMAGAVLVPLMIGYWAFTKDEAPEVVKAVEAGNIPAAERRLKEVRQTAASVPSKEQILQQATKDLTAREKGLIQADTAAQAQAQLVQILRKVGKAQSPGIDLRNSEIGTVKTFGDRYGEVSVSLNFEARMEQLVQFLSDLTAQTEIVGVNEVRVGQANPKEKTMPVRLTVSALVRRELVPEKKGSL
ncbi:MAG TPA: type II secretion system protein GspM [Bryobacteraceae bacterium]|nr:type II secretion system protein GspM [Bryobacteraceae bacterium]